MSGISNLFIGGVRGAGCWLLNADIPNSNPTCGQQWSLLFRQISEYSTTTQSFHFTALSFLKFKWHENTPAEAPQIVTSVIVEPILPTNYQTAMSPASVFAAKNTALITGGASGIGLAVAQLCRKHGMRVAVADWNVDYLSKAKSTLLEDKVPEDVETYQIDVSKSNGWKELKDKVVQKFGGSPDFLMLNAGIGVRGNWGDDEYFQKV
jgi:hypothetical protein